MSSHIRVNFFVWHSEMERHFGFKKGVTGVNIKHYVMGPEDWFKVGESMTNNKGQAAFTMYSNKAEAGQKWLFRHDFTKAAYEPTSIERQWEWEKEGQYEEVEIHEIGWTPPSEKVIDQTKWFVQEWQPRLAYSFVIALAIILTFKFLQGFSMDRVNPIS